jgi:hypothetical protein
MDPLIPLWSALSHPRLHLGFRASAGETETTVLARYIYNLALCEAFYPVLHALEIALRNSLDTVLSAHYPAGPASPRAADGLPAAGCWLDATPCLLGSREQEEVRKVKRRLLGERKSVTPHRLIAGLSLGFWAGLLTRRYEIGPGSSYAPVAGGQTALWPRHLRAVFPGLPRRHATRDHVYHVIRGVADLRNQVFHHRPIWRLPLAELHASATEAIGWMSPELRQVTHAGDRFPDLCRKGVAGYEKDLAAYLALAALHGREPAGDGEIPRS